MSDEVDWFDAHLLDLLDISHKLREGWLEVGGDKLLSSPIEENSSTLCHLVWLWRSNWVNVSNWQNENFKTAWAARDLVIPAGSCREGDYLAVWSSARPLDVQKYERNIQFSQMFAGPLPLIWFNTGLAGSIWPQSADSWISSRPATVRELPGLLNTGLFTVD